MHPGRGEVLAPGQGCRSPSVPGQPAAARQGGGDESPPALAWPQLIVCESLAPGRILPPRPSCTCYLCPTADPGQRQWPLGSSQARLISQPPQSGEDTFAFLACWQLSTPGEVLRAGVGSQAVKSHAASTGQAED